MLCKYRTTEQWKHISVYLACFHNLCKFFCHVHLLVFITSVLLCFVSLCLSTCFLTWNIPIHVSAFVSECHNGKQILQKWKEKQKKERMKNDNFIHNPKDTTSIQKKLWNKLEVQKNIYCYNLLLYNIVLYYFINRACWKVRHLSEIILLQLIKWNFWIIVQFI